MIKVNIIISQNNIKLNMNYEKIDYDGFKIIEPKEIKL